VNWGAVIVAAGRGTRFGRPKQLIDLGGQPLVTWSIATFAAMPEVVEIVVTTEPEFLDEMASAVRTFAGNVPLRVVPGGATRQASVRAGLAALSDRSDGAFVHDGARPLVQAADVRAGMREVRAGRGALLATPAIDTVKIVDAERRVQETLDRARLWNAQTPQFGMRADLIRAHDEGARSGSPPATDDAALLERIGVEVVVVEAAAENFKVTLPGDLIRAEAIMRGRAEPVRP
jgi:2-C-methyl-D-erythritol 4-phosphate cytidylyltransferase